MRKFKLKNVLQYIVFVIYTIIFYIVLLFGSAFANAEEIILSIQNQDDIVIICNGDTLHAFAYGKQKVINNEPLDIIDNSSNYSDKQNQIIYETSYDYFSKGDAEKGLKVRKEEAEEFEKSGKYVDAFYAYLDVFEEEKAKEMLQKYIRIDKKNSWEISILANMYRSLNMKTEYIDTISLLKN